MKCFNNQLVFMKKVLAILTIAALGLSFAPKASAIDDPWEKGTLVVGAMAGFYPGIGGSLTGDYVLVDHLWIGHLTAGAQVFFQSLKYHDIDGDSRYWKFAAVPRVTYGLNITERFEVHIGATAGMGFSQKAEPGHKLGVCFGTLAGVRFFFTENFGLQAEFNYTYPFGEHSYTPYGTAGIAFKF